ncbi:MAG: HAMP domain-containing histidine kinase [Chloroflexi bacterium]|nr:HAMP domain-containing histidine kinase [Chloroflexota bacterium]
MLSVDQPGPTGQFGAPDWTLQSWTSTSSGELLQAISDELGSGLSSIISAREVLLSLKPGTSIETTRQLMTVMTRGISRLATLGQCLRDVLDLADIHRGTASLSREWIDVRQLLQEAVEEITSPAGFQAAPFDIRMEGRGPIFQVDPARMRRALVNLFTYARRCAQSTETVAIRGRTYPEAFELLAESGPQIRTGAVNEEAAARGERRARLLALFVARGYVQLHGGTLRVDTKGGKVTVSCRLPTGQAG